MTLDAIAVEGFGKVRLVTPDGSGRLEFRLDLEEGRPGCYPVDIVRYAINSRYRVNTHQANHPSTERAIMTVDVRDIAPEERMDYLLTTGADLLRKMERAARLQLESLKTQDPSSIVSLASHPRATQTTHDRKQPYRNPQQLARR